MKRRSVARSSTSWLPARSRAKGMGGSLRLLMTVQVRWKMAQQKGQAVMNDGVFDRVVVIKDQRELGGLGLEMVD